MLDFKALAKQNNLSRGIRCHLWMLPHSLFQGIPRVASRRTKRILQPRRFRRLYHESSPSFSPTARLALKREPNTYHSEVSELGLRSYLPPDSNPNPDPDNLLPTSDQDWEIRTGRFGSPPPLFMTLLILPLAFSSWYRTCNIRTTTYPSRIFPHRTYHFG